MGGSGGIRESKVDVKVVTKSSRFIGDGNGQTWTQGGLGFKFSARVAACHRPSSFESTDDKRRTRIQSQSKSWRM